MKTVGILGVGSIAEIYVKTLKSARNCRVVAVAARDMARTRERATAWGLAAETPEALIARPDIDVILNLTPPAAHLDTTRAALAAGKHVFSEKPLGINFQEASLLMRVADERGLRLGVAPDTMFGPAFQTARQLIEDGRIGTPLLAGASILYHGADDWHPNPAFFYRASGGGPIHDVGPYFIGALVHLLGPVSQVMARSLRGFETRTFTAEGAEKGLTVSVDVPTSVLALLTFRSGAEATLSASWDVWKTAQPALEIHGTSGSLLLPHPAWHGGELKLAAPRGSWQVVPMPQSVLAQPNWPPTRPNSCNYRGIGLLEMIDAIENNRPHATAMDVAAHIVEAADAIMRSAERNAPVALTSAPSNPAPVPQDRIDHLIT